MIPTDQHTKNRCKNHTFKVTGEGRKWRILNTQRGRALLVTEFNDEAIVCDAPPR